ncbi:MAG: SigB/SigF/SigG family RNA polymerase sigma factor [Acidimicrobiales bacterium]
MAIDADRRDELRTKFSQYAATRSPHLRDELVGAHLSLAEFLARRFVNRGEPLDDLIQVASLALVKAVDRFDPGRGLEFSTFATPTIVGELKRHFRDKGWAVRVPRRVQELHLRLGAIVAGLSQDLGRSPTVAEIAEVARASEDDVLEAIEAGAAYRFTSIDAPGGAGEDQALSETLGTHDRGLADSENRAMLSPLLAKVPPRERLIIQLRFFEGLTQSQIATRLGVSQMHISRLLARTLADLRETATAAGEGPAQA